MSQEAASTQRDDSDQVLQAVKFTDKKVLGLHLDLDEEFQAAGCFYEVIRGCLLASFANASTSLASNASPRPLPAHFATFSWAASRSPAHLATLCWAASCYSSAFCSLSGRPPCGVLCPYTERFLTNLFWRRKATLGTSLALNAFRRALRLAPTACRRQKCCSWHALPLPYSDIYIYIVIYSYSDI